MNQTARKRQKVEESTDEPSSRGDEDTIKEAAAQTLAQLSRDINQEALMDADAVEEARLLTHLSESQPETSMEGEETEGVSRRRNQQTLGEEHTWLMAPKTERHTRVGSAFQVAELPVWQPKEERGEEEKEG